MLYIYSLSDYYKKSKEEINAIIECKELKKINGENYDDEYEYIGKEKLFISNGKEIFADLTLDDWIEGNLDFEWSEFDLTHLFIDEFSFNNRPAVEILMDELKDKDSEFEYSERIFNSENPYSEMKIIVDEITLVLLETAIIEIGKEIREIKRINWK